MPKSIQCFNVVIKMKTVKWLAIQSNPSPVSDEIISAD